MKTKRLHICYPVEHAAKLMGVPADTLKRSAWARPMNGGYYVSEVCVNYWIHSKSTPFCREKLMLPKRQFMEYITPLLADMPENDLNIMLDAFSILLKELKNETEH